MLQPAVPGSPDPATSDVSHFQLIDTVNARRYLVARTADDPCVCSSTGGILLHGGESTALSACYEAPPAGVTSVDLAQSMITEAVVTAARSPWRARRRTVAS